MMSNSQIGAMKLVVRTFEVNGYVKTELAVAGNTFDAKDAIKGVVFDVPEGDKGTRFRWSHALDEKARIRDRDGCDWVAAESTLDANYGKQARRWRVTWDGQPEEHKERIGHAAQALGLRYPSLPPKTEEPAARNDVAPAGPEEDGADLPF